jgi:hypothetical protein
MGITKAKIYGVLENKNLHNNFKIDLISKEEDNQSIPDQETANNIQETDSVESMNNKPETRLEKIPHWQRNLTTFYNPELGRVELAEYAYLRMLSGYNEPRTFKEAWNHPDH